MLSTPSSMKLLSRARWPLAENDAEARQARLPAPSMLAPGIPRSTPGTVRVRLTKLRPLSGSASICSLVTVVPSSDEEVWTSGDSAWMVTDSESAPTSSLTSMRTRWSTPSSTSDMVTVLKPEISAATVYLPVGSDGAEYSPFGVGHDDAGQFGAGVGERHVDAGDDGARRVRHATDDRAGHGLRRGGRGGEGD